MSEPVTTTDEQLLARAGEGDFAAFQQLVSRFQRRVFGLARRIVGQEQDAEDVTQQTFLSLLEHLESFRGESSVATWILKIATNHALKVLRKRRGLRTVSLDVPGDDGGSLPHPEYIAQWSRTPQQLLEDAEIQSLVEVALQELDEKYRLVFILRDVEGVSTRETAELLDLSESNVKVRLLRARLMLRERLTRAFGDDATRIVSDHDHH